MVKMILWLAVLAVVGGEGEVCSPELKARSLKAMEMQDTALNATLSGPDGGLQVQAIDDHRLLITSDLPELTELGINGSSARFAFQTVNDISAVVLEQCGLARSAIDLTAGSQYVAWVSPDFHKARPDVDVEARSLQTLSLPSSALGRDREVYLVAGEGWSAANGDPLLISGDGLAGSSFGAIVEELIRSEHTRPIAFASARFGEGRVDDASVALRSAEYHLPGDSATDSRRAAYASHEKFFFEEFLLFVIEQLGGEVGPVYMFGISSSGSFALDQGLKRQDEIAGVIAASPPIQPATKLLAEQAETSQTIHLWCGTLEDRFCAPIVKLSGQHGYRVETRHASHTTALWEEALSASIIELFPPRSD